MSDGKIPPGRPSRRTFLAGLLTGAGVAAAVGHAATSTASDGRTAAAPAGPAAGAILYRRTEDVERYYRSLHRG